jgi:hypothetical protein
MSRTNQRARQTNKIEEFLVGRVLRTQENDAPLELVTDEPLFRPYLKTSWLHGFVEERLGISPKQKSENSSPSEFLVGANFALPDDSLARHVALFGSSGSGKSRLAFHLLQEQLKVGYSAVALDPKPDTIEHLLALAKAAGLRPEQITLLVPTDAENAVGWNPLDYVVSGLPVAQVVGAFVSILEQGATSWGPRLREVLVNALTVISAKRLSLFEVVQFLRREDYRVGLLNEITCAGYGSYSFEDALTVREATEYFLRDFAGWSKSERVSATGPVLNKLSELLRVPFLRAMLCAKESVLDLAAIWQEPRFIIVHLDRTVLGDEGVRLLGGLICWQLYQTAMRVEGPVPVILSLDEMGVGVQFIGKAVCEILAIARSRKLRLLLACQFLDQLGEELRTALLSTTGIRVFFRLGYPDAKLVAASLGAGTGESIQKVSLEVGKGDTIAQIPHRILDAWGRQVALTPVAWEALREFTHHSTLADADISGLNSLALLSGANRLYVFPYGKSNSPKQAVELGKYITGLSPYKTPLPWEEETNEPIGYWIKGPSPLFLMIRLPRPRFQVVAKQTESERSQKWLRMLMDLPVQQAVVQMAGVSCTIKVLNVPDVNKKQVPQYVEQIRKVGQGSDLKKVRHLREETENWRRGEIERVASGIPATLLPKVIEIAMVLPDPVEILPEEPLTFPAKDEITEVEITGKPEPEAPEIVETVAPIVEVAPPAESIELPVEPCKVSQAKAPDGSLW